MRRPAFDSLDCSLKLSNRRHLPATPTTSTNDLFTKNLDHNQLTKSKVHWRNTEGKSAHDTTHGSLESSATVYGTSPQRHGRIDPWIQSASSGAQNRDSGPQNRIDSITQQRSLSPSMNPRFPLNELKINGFHQIKARPNALEHYDNNNNESPGKRRRLLPETPVKVAHLPTKESSTKEATASRQNLSSTKSQESRVLFLDSEIYQSTARGSSQISRSYQGSALDSNLYHTEDTKAYQGFELEPRTLDSGKDLSRTLRSFDTNASGYPKAKTSEISIYAKLRERLEHSVAGSIAETMKREGVEFLKHSKPRASSLNSTKLSPKSVHFLETNLTSKIKSKPELNFEQKNECFEIWPGPTPTHTGFEPRPVIRKHQSRYDEWNEKDPLGYSNEDSRDQETMLNLTQRKTSPRTVKAVANAKRVLNPRLTLKNDADPSQEDWLSTKLKKLKSKRDVDPEIARRRTQEKMLLEELKNANEHRGGQRDHLVNEGALPRDPLEAYRREEERLRNTSSPFDEMPKRHARGVRGKPPTPPPRERSRSPPQSRVHTPSVDQYKLDQSRAGNVSQNGFSTRDTKETNIDDDYGDFAHLGNILKNENGSTTAPRHSQPSTPHHQSARSQQPKKSSFNASEYARPSTVDPNTWARGRETPSAQFPDTRYSEWGSLSHAQTPAGQFFSGQERVAAAIARAETPVRQFYGTQDRSPSVTGRAETPHFPIRGETPLPYHPLLYSQGTASRGDLSRERNDQYGMNYRSASPRSNYYNQSLSRRSSLNSVDPGEIIHHHPVFVKDVSKYWYKPMISREQAINMLRDKPPGTFVVRDSNSFPGAFGLALKVATPPPGVQAGDGTELVRHFLIEPSPKGVKLKGCNNEPVFGSLSALVYQHSITPLALPTKLILPDYDPATSVEHVSAAQLLLEQGAACNVSFIGSVDCESLTGPACVKRCIHQMFDDQRMGYLTPVSVHFKVSSQGVTLTDNTRKLFFRRHFPTNSVIYAGADPEDQRWDNTEVIGFSDGCVRSAKLFAVVARKVNQLENQCHVFAELEPEQPAHAVLNFINKVLLSPSRRS